jgi:hypothetical protein
MLPLSVQALVFVAGFFAGSTSAHPTTAHYDRIDITTAPRGYDIPIRRTPVRRQRIQRRGTLSGQSGLGDLSDL